MTEAPLKLSYPLAGYDYGAACGLLTARLLPARHQRHAFLILLAVLLLFWVGQLMGAHLGYGVGGYAVAAFLAAGLVLWIAAFRRRQARLWAAFADAPARRGTTTLTVDDEGMTFSTDGSRSTLFWSGIADIIEGKDGLLVLPGDMEFIPIPDRAFASEADKRALLADLRARLARDKADVE